MTTQSNIHEQIERLLDADEADFRELNLVEREGEAAFEALRGRLEALDGPKRARALNLLLTLTRQFCIRRLPDAVRTAVAYTENDDREVRSAAVSVAARGSLVMRAFRELEGIVPPPPSREEVHAAITNAIAMGIDEVALQEADRFMKQESRGAPPE